jgi:hypothetical protein
MKVETEADLGRLRHAVGRLRHDDERLRDRIVSLMRHGSIIGRIVCATEGLAWDAYRLVAGMRFRVEDGPAWQDAAPMAIAA